MCLTITVEIPGLTTSELGGIARRISGPDLDFSVQGTGLLGRHQPRLALHACDLLSDEADWNAPTWAMNDERADRLRKAFERLFELAAGDVTVTALWDGDRPETDELATRGELLETIAAGGLGTKTRYVIPT
jgi:hypothetical protein